MLQYETPYYLGLSKAGKRLEHRDCGPFQGGEEFFFFPFHRSSSCNGNDIGGGAWRCRPRGPVRPGPEAFNVAPSKHEGTMLPIHGVPGFRTVFV